MPISSLMGRLKNWFGNRDDKLLDPDQVSVTEWLDKSLNSEDDHREFHPQRSARSSLSLRKLSMIVTRIDKDSKNEECRCLATNMCPNGTSDPVPCTIHAAA